MMYRKNDAFSLVKCMPICAELSEDHLLDFAVNRSTNHKYARKTIFLHFRSSDLDLFTSNLLPAQLLVFGVIFTKFEVSSLQFE